MNKFLVGLVIIECIATFQELKQPRKGQHLDNTISELQGKTRNDGMTWLTVWRNDGMSECLNVRITGWPDFLVTPEWILQDWFSQVEVANSLLHGPVVLLALVVHPAGREVEQRTQELGDVVALVVEEDFPDDHVVGVERVELDLERTQPQPGWVPVGVSAVQLAKLGRGLKPKGRVSILCGSKR